uniref:Uncharacterized protein n=1 Tax=viral metagenome TaxID=1070528 RepID=A0A6C0DFG8_9ZZZZ
MKINLFIYGIATLLSVIIIFYWTNYLFKNNYIQEAFTKMSAIKEGPDTTHSVNLPNPAFTEYTCKNICGPPGRCRITGEDCVSDVDCYGCVPPPVYNREIKEQTTDIKPVMSTFTKDITKSATYIDPGAKPAKYNMGVDMWKSNFDLEENIFKEKYYPSGNLSLMMKYPVRTTFSGEFIDDGAFAFNDST